MRETFETEGPKCPYCGRQYTADEDSYFDEQNYTSETCDACGKAFAVLVYTSTSWTCSPIQDAAPPEVAGEAAPSLAGSGRSYPFNPKPEGK